jgi:hypothetical protein
VRAAALEFLGNLLEAKHKLTLIPLLESTSWEELDRRGRQLFDLPEPTFEETLGQFVEGPDAWLSACALALVGELELHRVRRAVQNVLGHSVPVVREAARSTLDRLDKR